MAPVFKWLSGWWVTYKRCSCQGTLLRYRGLQLTSAGWHQDWGSVRDAGEAYDGYTGQHQHAVAVEAEPWNIKITYIRVRLRTIFPSSWSGRVCGQNCGILKTPAVTFSFKIVVKMIRNYGDRRLAHRPLFKYLIIPHSIYLHNITLESRRSKQSLTCKDPVINWWPTVYVH